MTTSVPAFGTVEHFERTLGENADRVSNVFAFAHGMIRSFAESETTDDAEARRLILAVTAAVKRIQAQPRPDEDTAECQIPGCAPHFIGAPCPDVRERMRGKVMAAAEPPVLQDWRDQVALASPADRRTCVDPGDQEHDHEMCKDVVAEGRDHDGPGVECMRCKAEGFEGVHHDAHPSAQRQALLWKRTVMARGGYDQAAEQAALDDAHEVALVEDNDRAKAVILAGMRDGEGGRIVNPNLARYLAVREDRRRSALASAD